jgi:sugar phosphate isomerase/epimerase
VNGFRNWPEIPLSVTLEPLMQAGEGDFRATIDRVAQTSLRYVQLSATAPGLRPRELDRSARRDLLAILRRHELSVSGIDAWIPPHHLTQAAHVDRAVTAIIQTIELAGDLGRCGVSVLLPHEPDEQSSPKASDPLAALAQPARPALKPILQTLAATADRLGVMIVDHAAPLQARENFALGLDPAAALAQGNDPAQQVIALGSRIGSARLCDLLTSGMRGPIGEPRTARLDTLNYKTALNVIEYRRPVIIDVRQWVEPWPGVQQTVREWNSIDQLAQ